MVIIGSLFGDASLLVTGKDRVPNFYENHAMKQLEYLKWKALMLGRPNGVRFRIMSHGYCKGKSIPYFQVRDKVFVDLEKMFYIRTENGRRKKIVTAEALELLVGSPLALAVFYMDDGEYDAYSNQAILNTCDFTLEENNMIASRLSTLLRGSTRVTMKRYIYPRLNLSSKATDEFVRIVKPFIHPTLQYKVDQNIAHHIDQQIVKKLMVEYGKKPAKQISKDTGLTIMEVYVIAYRLGLTKRIGYIRYRNKPFTEQEKEYLVKSYGKVPINEIASRLNTSIRYVYQLAMKLGLTKGVRKPNN